MHLRFYLNVTDLHCILIKATARLAAIHGKLRLFIDECILFVNKLCDETCEGFIKDMAFLWMSFASIDRVRLHYTSARFITL